ncbi:hypothetical protein WN55_10570 [Dufourea novaeangliae]|uniref:Transposable element P transposase-like RNase H domain-containing protein n=1 Tax=Dufourea novaeangliae TaxID=178035 RepID=A0A154P3Y6_DUFNO|nr:hypothetical protein WN55_10570 [Dufourea novaeangliae]
MDIWPGICSNLFTALKIKSALSFDEAAIKMCLDYHKNKQVIEGFEDLRFLGRNLAVDSQVLVFMLRRKFTN